MKRRRRDAILLGIIAIGLLNFVSYAISYSILGGDACNGAYDNGEYLLRGHFVREPGGLFSDPVSRNVWIYSYIHSISIWPTIGAVLMSMFLLARPHIIALMQSDAWLSGRAVADLWIVIILALTLVTSGYFIASFVHALDLTNKGQPFGH
jgi:hypothetical protein